MALRRIETDEFIMVAKALYGEGAWEIVKSRAPKSDEDRKKFERRQAQVGLASNIVGLAAGAAGTASALRDDRFKEGGKVARKLYRAGQKIPKPISSKTGKAGAALAGGALGLQVANIAGDAVANRVLARSSKKKVSKAEDPKRTLQLRALSEAETKARKLAPVVAEKSKKKVGSFKVEAKVSKALEDKRQVYGWASITEMDGQPVVDLQGDYVTIEEIEKAAHSYISKSRKGGDMHLRNGQEPHHVADLIESVVITPEKKEALGLPADSPTGWWVGFQVNDEKTWELVKKGDRPMFSIHGSGRRQEVEIEA